MKKLILSIFLFSLFISSNESTAQVSINELLEKPKKHKDAWHVPAASSQIKNWQVRKGHCAASDYVMPKRVGILTVYIQDDAQFLYSTSTQRVYEHATKDGVNELAQIIFSTALPEIKQSFSSRGMELLEPYEYMDSQEKIEAYINWSPGNGAVAKWLQKKLVDNKINGYSAVAAGYRFMPLHQTFQDNKFRKNLDELMLTLDMDAYLVISINMRGGDEVERMDATIHYKNPAHGSKTTYGAFSEKVGGQLRGPYKDILLQEERKVPNKKGKLKKQMVTVGVNPNISTAMTQLTEGVCRAMETWIEGGKKKKKKK